MVSAAFLQEMEEKVVFRGVRGTRVRRGEKKYVGKNPSIPFHEQLTLSISGQGSQKKIA